MNLETKLAEVSDANRLLTLAEGAELSCDVARQFEKVGEYEAAREALAEFWPDRDAPPKVDGLDEPLAAEILRQVGCLQGWLSAAEQAAGGQEAAKNLITQSIDLFERLQLPAKVAGAQGDLALCYWREGAYDEARVTLEHALKSVPAGDSDLKATLLIRAATVAISAHRLSEAFRIFSEAAPLVEQSTDDALKGSYHSLFAVLFRRLVTDETRDEYVDRALIEYAAASFHFERAGNIRYVARVENNLGFLFFTIGRYEQAHTHLDRARQLFIELKDTGTIAQVDETRARTFLAGGRLADAERVIRSAVKVLERGDEQAVLAEALTTFGTVKARLGKFVRARQLLDRSIEIAETCGDLEGAGRAKLSIIEELTAQTPPLELAATYEAAANLLKKSQNPATTSRLNSSALIVIDALRGSGDEPQTVIAESWEDFSLKREVRGFEKSLIERALRDSGGAVTKAAHLLGFKHHQSLISLINSRHRDLLNQRSAVRPRRSHLFSKPRKAKRKLPVANTSRTAAHIRVLHVEDDKSVADMAREMLTAEKWEVELCTDGDSALRKLTDNDHYDVVIVDSSLAGLGGLELARRARKITHRRRTPILMLSADDLESKAWGAGVDAFLKKPEQLSQLTSTVARLLREGSKNR